ncbi:putative monocarboxylate permease [Aaosphaeria arxii CBS 175.79]|uniref:Putative monocarboxylate permease n=1 Tax=Aaosphaeria arxii CBS 175.79 TaxID=1450172 RepID=A0A6A5Y2S6_9PLEO|nr:putative monocarboxylate permease [Aaosphaeria arxii CBS 175.79]KAF2019536.1 putative monocarboxylate permease [Aaosphaeria arxii CBS 175.79]
MAYPTTTSGRNSAVELPSTAVSDEKTTQESGSSSVSLPSRDGNNDATSHDKSQEKIEANGGKEVNAPVKDDAEIEDDQQYAGDEQGLNKVVSRKSVRDTSSIPNGGLVAWLQVLGAFFLLFNTWGIVNTFGSYQTYYNTVLLVDSNASAVSWIGSIQGFLLMMVGALSGPIYDAGYFRTLLISGSLLLVIGQMMLSLCHEYWQVLLAQAFCIGTGTGFLFVPAVAILNTYFTTKISTAVGLAASGSSFGGIIYPIVFHRLLPQIGFGWTTRVIGFIIIATQVIPLTVMRVRVLPKKSRSLLDLNAFTIAPYSLNIAGFFVGFMGLYMPFFYAQFYALQRHITNPDLAFYLLAVMNSTSIFGRTIPNVIADRIGVFNVVVPCTIFSAILCFCFAAVHTSAAIIVLMAFYGFFSGSFVSIPPAIVVSLSLDAREKIGTRMGQTFAIIAVGLLIGTPIGGAILDHSGFESIWIYGGCLLLGSAVFLVAARVTHKGWGLMVKA